MPVNDSFFEVYERETVYQLFDYSIMKYMKYNFKLKDNKVHDGKEENIKVTLKDMEKENLQYIKLNSENNNYIEKKMHLKKNRVKFGISNDNKNIKNITIELQKKIKR